MKVEFEGTVWFWKGPAPWYFVTIPPGPSSDIKMISNAVTYGWGVIPVRVQIGETDWETSLFPKNDAYLVPIKASVRKAESIEEGDTVRIDLEIRT